MFVTSNINIFYIKGKALHTLQDRRSARDWQNVSSHSIQSNPQGSVECVKIRLVIQTMQPITSRYSIQMPGNNPNKELRVLV